MQYIPIIQVRTNSLIMYNEPTEPRYHLKVSNPFKHLPKSYSGTVTEGAKKRITKAVTLLIQSTPERIVKNPVTNSTHPFKLSFITLTVSSTSKMLTASDAHKTLLEPFLLYLRRNHQMRSYIWKAELQERGQIHYHLTSDCFINHTTLRNKWNEYQNKAGLLDDYYNLKGHYNANSTDVHSVYKIKNIEAYLIKYMAKAVKKPHGDNAEGDNINYRTKGKVWDCSLNLKHNSYFTTTATYNYDKELYKRERAENITVVRAERFTLIKFNNGFANQILSKADRQQYRDYMQYVRNYTKADHPGKSKSPPDPGTFIPHKSKSTAYTQMRIHFSQKI